MTALFWHTYLPVLIVIGGLAGIASPYRPRWFRCWRVRRERQRYEQERERKRRALEGAATAQDRFIRRLH